MEPPKGAVQDSKKEGKPEKKEGAAKRVKEEGRGTVKSVLSGDTIVVIEHDKNHRGPPVERVIAFTSIVAPRLGNRKADKEHKDDEPFAWLSREFLRKKCIGKPVSFSIENKLPNKEYGHVWLGNDLQNLAQLIVGEGWASVRSPSNVPKEGLKPEIQTLLDLEEQAKKNEKGIWTKKDELIEKSKRPHPPVNPPELFDKLKGKPQTGVLEYVRSGSSLRVILLPNFYDISLNLSGVDCPSQDKEKNWEPFGKEAKFFTEHYLLHRDVQVLIEGADKFNFYGTVSYSGKNIAVELLKNGLGKFVEWSAAKSNFNENLKAAELEAKKAKLRIWSGFEEPKAAPATGKPEDKKAYKVGREITGVAFEVVHGGFLKILDNGKNEHKVYLSSIRLPRNGSVVAVAKEKEERKEGVERTLAWDAREYVRKRVVGQKVRAVVEYMRTPEQGTKEQKPETRIYCSVYVERNNVAVELVDRGFASAVNHQGSELRSKDYEQIVFAEQRAKKALKGVWAPVASAPILHLVDLSVAEPKVARGFLAGLKRAARQRAVVETEFSGARIKVWVPKENCLIAFSIAGVKCPKASEDCGPAAKAFTKERIHQRDVEIEVLNFVEKSGSFVGNLWIKGENIASLLLEEGLAQTIPGALRELAFGNDYRGAQSVAQKSRRNIWKDYDEAKEKAEKAKKAEEKTEYLDILVTEILDGSNFYIQIVGSEAQKLEELMKALSEDNTPSVVPKVGDLVKAQFTLDDQWYRAQVKATTPEGNFQVFYIDYGNEEDIPASRIRQLPEEANEKVLTAQAHKAFLALVRAPSISEDFGREAADLLKELVWGKSMLAQVDFKDAGVYCVSLLDRESQVHINAALLRAGLVRLDRSKGRSSRSMYDKLKEQQDKAKAAHVYIWEYGDPGSSDEEVEIPKKGVKGGKPSKN